ncbi:extracellular matrix regulator RemB [Garciella nitratireducens]|uniref:DUF370 domain-containing protein n=1 Tax=Garciella nitratireducens DSM 15102 TaxID=1121911 RepID=A0A1T4PCQ6_9FIRM|nr:extracellular matrix/biofilm biosynthesis regulator RemA family protein [Garciella nitratireducens]RBP36152.1 uncharacterized protein DUF370 [Garciella nitratireducens]SJZ89279.1 protein of unknown function [Garciella nitratireducens DSM 15102]
MLLHLGEDEMVLLKDIVAIINLEQDYIPKYTQEFLEIVEEKGLIKRISQNPKSFVLTEIDHKFFIYYSPISSSTLLKRMGFIDRLSQEELI